jgi:hypothetical protein
MRKGNEAHVTAKGFEDMPLIQSLTVFTESNEVDSVLTGEFTQEVEGALIGAAIERERNVRIDDEEVHVS